MAVTVLDDKTALVLIDLQTSTLAAATRPYPTVDVVARAAELADAFRAAGAPVVLVRMATSPDGADAVPGRSEAVRLAGGRARPYDLGPVVEPLAGHDGDVLVTKRNWGAFHGTDLDVQLRRRGVTQIVLGGIATSLGVESTARAAHEHGYHLTFAVDAMTDIDEDAHRHSVSYLFPLIGEPGTTKEILALLAAARA
ncbi:Nicotinamidase-related amidase [Streptomyces sp. yr375]|uniref:isochorismatase family protein n=1 Tax=Streptomyces sp. yr375 TaxID=1761906 RepID=UPI0008C5A3F8|nr:isochorismatase family protein [Streptomyces sp. yr375]SES12786.1 Nicotinamidase-related amidase [Streptomyces sp. yr375]